MKIRQIPVPEDLLAARHLPADYSDAFECVCALLPTVTPDDMQIAFWTRSPKWVDALMRLRNWLVKPFGLKGGNGGSREKFRESILKGITDRSQTETVTGKDDKHLQFYCSIQILRPDNSSMARITVSTIVRFHNRLGRVYFSIIRPFHKIIVCSTLKNTVRQLQ